MAMLHCGGPYPAAGDYSLHNPPGLCIKRLVLCAFIGLGGSGGESGVSVSPGLICRPDQRVRSTDKAWPVSFSLLSANG